VTLAITHALNAILILLMDVQLVHRENFFMYKKQSKIILKLKKDLIKKE
jgi:hypothetical protein